MTDDITDPALQGLIDHLRRYAVRTDGPFTLRSGEESPWYIDARQTTFDAGGAALVGAAVATRIPDGVTAVGGMTMGADPIALATALHVGPPMRAFSVRKTAKGHGAGDDRLVGPVSGSDLVLVLEDTTTTGGALMETIDVLTSAGVTVVGALALVDRSDGAVAARCSAADVDYTALITPETLGVTAAAAAER